jgi:hypothetical protein
MSSLERSTRVSTLELFFDLVFVFTITQLGLRGRGSRLLAGSALATIAVGGELSSAAQTGALAAIVVGALVAEGSHSVSQQSK